MKGLFSTQLRSSELPEQVLSRLSQQIGDDISWKNFITLHQRKKWFGHIHDSSFHIRESSKWWRGFGASAFNIYGTVSVLPYQGGSQIDIKITVAKEILIYQAMILFLFTALYPYPIPFEIFLAFIITLLVSYLIGFRYTAYRFKRYLNIFD